MTPMFSAPSREAAIKGLSFVGPPHSRRRFESPRCFGWSSDWRLHAGLRARQLLGARISRGGGGLKAARACSGFPRHGCEAHRRRGRAFCLSLTTPWPGVVNLPRRRTRPTVLMLTLFTELTADIEAQYLDLASSTFPKRAVSRLTPMSDALCSTPRSA
jgi:hypothetical protein